MLDLSGASAGDTAAEKTAGDEMSAPHEAVLLTLVPNSSIQFLDLVLTPDAVARTRRRFYEEVAEDGEPSLNMASPGDGAIPHAGQGTPHDPRRIYSIGGIDALAPFLNTWMPLPFMRVSRHGESDAIALDEGPSNWTRAFVTADTSGDGEARYRVVIAIDTAIEANADPARSYASPTLDDMKSGAAFRFSDDVNDVAWFVSEAWVDDWIREAFARTPNDADTRDETGALQHLATYLTLLAVLKEACDLPAVRFMEPNAVGAYAETIAVDLAIDLGTCRTCAFLEERTGARKSSARAAEMQQRAPVPLTVRDLSQPWRETRGTFSSRLAFCRASFGNEALSRWSGRIQAFDWPIPVRLGAEADRLLRETAMPDADVGVSSPMNYLWDEAPSRHVWRFAGATAQETARRNPVVSGSVLAHLSEAGELLEARSAHLATTKPRFSRSSLVTFAAAELILHAAREINAPAWRRILGRPDVSRRLDHILVTPPAGLTEAELALLRRRFEAAVKLVWQTMGWAGEAHPLAPPQPTVRIVADAATSAQIAWLENEIGFKLRGRADKFLALTGRARAGFAGARVLRIATLDIGAVTSSLSVATCELSPGNAIAVSRQLCEGFDIGCDDVVREMARGLVLPALSNRLSDCKHPDAARLLETLMGAKERNRPQWVGDLGRRLVAELLAPAATALMQLYANSESDAGDAPSEPTIGTLLASVAAHAKTVADRLDVLAADEGADGFAPLDVPVPFLMRELAAAANRALKPLLDSTVQVMAALDCDVVLLAGAGASLPIVPGLVTAGMPLRPDRIVALSQHRFAAWFPPTAAGSPAKLCAVVGALVQGRGAFGNGGPEIVLKAGDRTPTGAFIGRLGADGLIAADDVLFEVQAPGGSRSPARSNQPEQARTSAATLPLVIGMRTPSLVSWPARATWTIDRDPALPGRGPKLPLRVVLELKPSERGQPLDLKLVSVADRDGGRLDPSEVVLRLKTRRFAEGHWLDTGHLLDTPTGTSP